MDRRNCNIRSRRDCKCGAMNQRQKSIVFSAVVAFLMNQALTTDGASYLGSLLLNIGQLLDAAGTVGEVCAPPPPPNHNNGCGNGYY